MMRVDGKPALDYFIGTAKLKANRCWMTSVLPSVDTDVILFDIASKEPHQQCSQARCHHNGIPRAFNEKVGYSYQYPRMADLEHQAGCRGQTRKIPVSVFASNLKLGMPAGGIDIEQDTLFRQIVRVL